MHKLKSIAIILLLTYFFVPNLFSQWRESNFRNSDQLSNTIIAAHIEHELEPGKNIVYCGTIQLIWNELIDNFIKEPIQLEGEPEITHFLNKQFISKKDLSEDCYFTIADFGKNGVIEKIRKTLHEKFNTDLNIDFNVSSDEIFAFAYLQKNVPFRYKFEVSASPIHFNQKTNVEAFGLDDLRIGFRYGEPDPDKEESGISNDDENSEAIITDDVDDIDFRSEKQKKADQVYILDYKNDDDFIIRLKSKKIRNELILAKIQPAKTLLETYNLVRQRISNSKEISFLQEKEILRIPIIDFNVIHQFTELSHKKILNRNYSNTPIGQVSQSIQFRLDETGATLVSMARVVISGISEKIPRYFIFDSPFLLYLKEKGASYPYLLVWIDNSELLVKSQKKAKSIRKEKYETITIEPVHLMNDESNAKQSNNETVWFDGMSPQ